jgi:hypothetical protein
VVVPGHSFTQSAAAGVKTGFGVVPVKMFHAPPFVNTQVPSS